MPFFCSGKLDAVFTPSEAKNGYFTPSEADAIEKQFESFFKKVGAKKNYHYRDEE